MWPFRRKESIRELLEALTEDFEERIDKLEGQLKGAVNEFKEYARKAEEEKKALGVELKAKTTFIEGLFADMLTKNYAQQAKDTTKEERKENSDLVDISKLSETHKGFVRSKLAEAAKANTNGAKKLP